MTKVVIVESPAKAKTINKYLGKDYEVLASFGHVRDLPAQDGSVRPDEDFAMTYQVEDDSKKHIQAIARAVKDADALYLATDPDREGEAISWHVLEALNERKAIKKGTEVNRITFNEITKSAVTYAIEHPRQIDMDLVNAQQARRAMDYLVGFNISPLLWRKLPGSKSAGRVQSVALRLVCEREAEIERFRAEEYWDIEGLFTTPKGIDFTARLTHFRNDKLDKFSFRNEAEATSTVKALAGLNYSVRSVEAKEVKRHPFAPFTTSTLQQEASRKLGFSAKKTMQLAQRLYEGIDIGGETVGLITYMRTDGVYVAQEAIQATRGMIERNHGADYLPPSPRMYQSKAKNAQEAHEAIRPTDVTRIPDKLARALEGDQARLYQLIWTRMVASQMASARLEQTTAEIESDGGVGTFRATGTVVRFPGFLALYTESKDEDSEDEDGRQLPALAKGDKTPVKSVTPNQHFTQPPPRFSEASLVKRLEELGIGRPSTYASILSLLIDREYVKLDKRRFFAEPRGRIVNAFLEGFFTRYVEYDFTARMEEQLDEVAEGKLDWKQVLRDWWIEFATHVESARELQPSKVVEEVDRLLSAYLYPASEDDKDPRACPSCDGGTLRLKAGKFGAFLGCDNYPDCNFTRQLGGEAGADDAGDSGPRELGEDPKSDEKVTLRTGRFGPYVQLGEGKEAKRSSLSKGMEPGSVTLEQALGLLSLPRDVGKHPESGEMITASIGRYGPYVKHGSTYANIPPEDDVLTIGINRAVDLLASKTQKRGGVEPLRELGEHPTEKGMIAVYEGKYGPYVKHGKVNATLPKGTAPEAVTLEQAVELIAAKAASPAKGKKRFTKKKTA